jgi:hypothetical protein
MKTWQKALLGILIAGVLVFGIVRGYVYYLNNKPHRDVKKEQGIEVTAEQLFKAYTTNEAHADTLYNNKAIQVSGVVKSVTKDDANMTSVELATSDPEVTINCKFKDDPGEIKTGSTITFKGICTGFLLTSIPINEGVIIKK